MIKTVKNVELTLTDQEKEVVAAAINTLGSIAAEYTEEKSGAESVSLDPMILKAVEALRPIIEALAD